MTRVPKADPQVFPRMYTPSGRLIHRVRRGEALWYPLCGQVPWWHDIAVEGVEAGERIEGKADFAFDSDHARKLKACELCEDRAGSFA